MVLSSAIVCDSLRIGSQTIANVCFHIIANDRKTFCDMRSAIVCNHMETRLKFPYCCLVTKINKPVPSKVESFLKRLAMNCLSWSFQVSNRPFDPCRTFLFLKRLLRNAKFLL